MEKTFKASTVYAALDEIAKREAETYSKIFFEMESLRDTLYSLKTKKWQQEKLSLDTVIGLLDELMALFPDGYQRKI